MANRAWRGERPTDEQTFVKYGSVLRYHRGPNARAASAPTRVWVHVDIRQACDKLGIAFDVLSEEIKTKALLNALNRACGPVLTEVRRAVAKQTSLPYGKVMAKIVADPAHMNRLEYRIRSSDQPTKLIDFAKGAKLGSQNVRVTVWGRTLTVKKSFVIAPRGKLMIAKRVGKHHGGIKSHKKGQTSYGPAPIKGLWGPIIPKEMIRPGFPSLESIKRVPERVQARLPHELEQAVARAKAASGT